MKKRISGNFTISLLIFSMIIILVLTACDDDISEPLLSKTSFQKIDEVSQYGPDFADLQARIYEDGGAPVLKTGACYSLKTTSTGDEMEFPTIADDTVQVNITVGLVKVSITGLIPDTVYFARIFAVNNGGKVGYGYPLRVETYARD